MDYLEDLRARRARWWRVTPSQAYEAVSASWRWIPSPRLNDAVNLDPATPYMETTIYPIISGSDRIKQLKKRLQREKGEEITLAQESPE